MSIVEKKTTAVRMTEHEFKALTFQEKRSYLRTRTAKEQMDLMIGDTDARRLAAALEPQEFFWLMKEIGEADALPLIELASPKQAVFILDMEIWEGWSFSHDKACHWLTYFMEGGEQKIHELLKHLDFEFLQLFLERELAVGGGIGDLSADEERLADYDHTFDGTFMLTFKNPKHSQLIGAFVEMILKLDHPLYVALMEGIKGDVEAELEEECQRFRNGRLQDLGFPPLDEALSIYARVNPETFEVYGDKKLSLAGEGGELVPIVQREETLFFRALALADSQTLLQELNYLMNSALVAEGTAIKDPEAMGGIVERVCGYLNIALQKLAGNDAEAASKLLLGETLKRLFQLGFSIVLDLHFTARDIQSTDYATGKLLAGLKGRRPRYYRGLDPDGIDGYREFKDMADVTRTAELLSHLPK